MFSKIGFILNLMTLSISICACAIALLVFVGILYHLYGNRTKQEDRVTMILSSNVYALILTYTTIVVSFNTQTLLGDLYGFNFDSSGCVFLAYLSNVLLSGLYWTFVSQVMKFFILGGQRSVSLLIYLGIVSSQSYSLFKISMASKKSTLYHLISDSISFHFYSLMSDARLG